MINVYNIKELEECDTTREWLDIRYPSEEYHIDELLKKMMWDVYEILNADILNVKLINSNIRLIKRLPTIEIMYKSILKNHQLSRYEYELLCLFEEIYINKNKDISNNFELLIAKAYSRFILHIKEES